ncbi:hypothetical protein [Devosia sp.]|uniref:hypothetical protein n=1 Tax=Devosia sp. TaxID=1871048 RepID=UPI001B2ED884|nr:hypothetical protein [Devosia sp.]MBO9587351.1 hypothetical protein [Devosia sp.]
MIPASYLYKDLYRQTWLDPDIENARDRRSTHGGGHPIRNLFATLFAHVPARLRRPALAPTALASDHC